MIRVQVFPPDATHTNFRLAWRDPSTGKQRKISAKTRIYRDAERAAALLQEKLEEGFAPPDRMSWEAFWKRYESQVMPGMAPKTQKACRTVKRLVDRLAPIPRLAAWSPQHLSRLVAGLRAEKKTEDSVKSYLGQLRAMLGWAVEQRLLPAVPKMPKLHRTRKLTPLTPLRGRPLSDAEFLRMKSETASTVGEKSASSWQAYLEGLWLSGLRLQESLDLTWDNPDCWSVSLTSGFPMLQVPRGKEKGFRDRLLPMAPEFADFLRAVDRDQRTGFVFNPGPVAANGGRQRTELRISDPDWAGTIIRRIAKNAGVETRPGRFATAHDLRRSFGERWSGRVQPADLMVLMRHRDIKTTMRYYVGKNAAQVAERIWAATGRTDPDCDPDCDPVRHKSPTEERASENASS